MGIATVIDLRDNDDNALKEKAMVEKAGMNFTNPLTAKHRLNNVLMYEVEEKWKVGNVKAAILTSLQKADSILKATF